VVVTKGDLAVEMFHRAVAAGMPFGDVAGDEVAVSDGLCKT
jgi:hypothetical protein